MISRLTVAAPWSLTHYMPLNGFHPLYHALFESRPESVRINSWDNSELSQKLRSDDDFRKKLINEIVNDTNALEKDAKSFNKKHKEIFWAPNRCLTRLLPGDIEFHHTAPFPSFERPFVFHCESFAPIFFPFSHQGTGSLSSVNELRDYYRNIFEDPLCLGIFSHLKETLEDISIFFSSPIIDEKLFYSRIGLSAKEERGDDLQIKKGALDSPVFIFVNSAHQQVGNFFLRGGHLALRFWQIKYPNSEATSARLIMRCSRPSDEMLATHGVDLVWLERHEHRSIIWIENFVTIKELDTLIDSAHFFLLPSVSLHSVSIMSAMAAGAIPIVSDTLGVSRYVTDAVDGIVLKGVYETNWSRDDRTGVRTDKYQRNPELEDQLVQQLVSKIDALLADPNEYTCIQSSAIKKASQEFSGVRYSLDFWEKVTQLYLALPDHLRGCLSPKREFPDVKYLLLEQDDWRRIFNSVPQPCVRLHTGYSTVTELGGVYISSPTNGSHELHHWSPIAEYVDSKAPPLIFSPTIKGLRGSFLPKPKSHIPGLHRYRLIILFSERLKRHPRLLAIITKALRHLRLIKKRLNFLVPKQPVYGELNEITGMAEIELVIENIRGLNVIRCGNYFYAVPRSAGEFSLDKAKSGAYDTCIEGTSIKEVLYKIEDNSIYSPDEIELIEDGVYGFNIIRCADVYYAIPQSEGAFDMARIQAGQYSKVYSDKDLVIVRNSIVGSVIK